MPRLVLALALLAPATACTTAECCNAILDSDDCWAENGCNYSRYGCVLGAKSSLAALFSRASDSCSLDDSEKVDCGELASTQSSCEASGCCWVESSSGGVPWCFYPAGTSSSCFVLPTDEATAADAPFSDDEVAAFTANFRSQLNIDGKGGVVAAPDENTPGGSYVFHWERDGALSNYCLLDAVGGAAGFDAVRADAESYARWVLARQSDDDPHGQDVRTEPKYELPDGGVFEGDWCRPQNDGPALRALALMRLVDDGANASFVAEYLWDGEGGGAIAVDLDYLADGYYSSTCDLWEESRSDDFFWNRAMMRKAALVGARFAMAQGGEVAGHLAATYAQTADAINASLYLHWTGSYLAELVDGDRAIDGATLVALNDAYDEDAGDAATYLAPTSVAVAQTVGAHASAFCREYAVNTADTAAGTPGVLVGRYPGDIYAGGNPWVLTTAALARLLYRAAAATHDAKAAPAGDALAAWRAALNADDDAAFADGADADAVAAGFVRAGDAVLSRLKAHVGGDGGRLDEQLDKQSGAQMSAKSLTWSYAEVLNAMRSRALFFA